MHWQLGEQDMARRASAIPFSLHLANANKPPRSPRGVSIMPPCIMRSDPVQIVPGPDVGQKQSLPPRYRVDERPLPPYLGHPGENAGCPLCPGHPPLPTPTGPYGPHEPPGPPRPPPSAPVVPSPAPDVIASPGLVLIRPLYHPQPTPLIPSKRPGSPALGRETSQNYDPIREVFSYHRRG